ncbi:hypothetical protein GCM10011613_13180 [Cellvibrio zantedeschiae]|uniref:Nitrate/nitrite sensing protein domain-containing protein n=1 Tax=Cellvibrio zantedeschiae TaxID=1237077 RepID=A0ABQ3AWL7_9GAMM|nr:nitrate- and nitrite sensing domain-containing protein [Cellvibrio zantedeschiae]GGY70138.1 hypothetical protein GCM10011613_13180 [Cellvibrio zantedeschiae]
MSLPFSFIFIFIVVPCIALFTAIYGVVKRKKMEEALFRSGISYLKRLRSLLMYIQQHRGLTNSFLSGNFSVVEDIQKVEVLTAREISEISTINGWIKENPKWDSIIDHWQRIHAHYQTVEAEVNLKQHNTLIANLLYLIDDLAYAHHLGKLGLIDATETDWRNLLFIAEYVGQARALGMGVVSKGFCTSVLRIQLNHLVVKIESNINPSWSEKIQKDFRNFLNVIEGQVIVDTPTISPVEYFKLATGCIEHVLVEFDRQVEKIQFHRT